MPYPFPGLMSGLPVDQTTHEGHYMWPTAAGAAAAAAAAAAQCHGPGRPTAASMMGGGTGGGVHPGSTPSLGPGQPPPHPLHSASGSPSASLLASHVSYPRLSPYDNSALSSFIYGSTMRGFSPELAPSYLQQMQLQRNLAAVAASSGAAGAAVAAAAASEQLQQQIQHQHNELMAAAAAQSAYHTALAEQSMFRTPSAGPFGGGVGAGGRKRALSVSPYSSSSEQAMDITSMIRFSP
ncbi:hypothetical protein HDE_09279 [Halotydeus destructor]|nr:hypothetical protein HDE_09279 [Halotydeus destructor]